MDNRAKILIALAVFCAVLYGGFIVVDYRTQTYPVWRSSMEPALHAGATVLVLKSGTVKRGSIVAFRPTESPNAREIQRVIAVGGDFVEMVDNRIRLNGKLLDEPYVRLSADTPFDTFGPRSIAKGEYFVVGDNRTSKDYRVFDSVPARNVIGPVILAFSPRRGVWRP